MEAVFATRYTRRQPVEFPKKKCIQVVRCDCIREVEINVILYNSGRNLATRYFAFNVASN